MPGPVGRFRAGKAGRIRFNATNCRLNQWSVQDSGADLDTTNFESYTTEYGTDSNGIGRSFEQGLIGQEVATFDCQGNWDQSANPMDNPPAIYARDDGPEMYLYLNRTDNTFYRFYATRILSASVTCDSKGLVTFSFNGKSQGPYLRPTGSTA